MSYNNEDFYILVAEMSKVRREVRDDKITKEQAFDKIVNLLEEDSFGIDMECIW